MCGAGGNKKNGKKKRMVVKKKSSKCYSKRERETEIEKEIGHD